VSRNPFRCRLWITSIGATASSHPLWHLNCDQRNPDQAGDDESIVALLGWSFVQERERLSLLRNQENVGLGFVTSPPERVALFG
jgi:hypothetical protein